MRRLSAFALLLLTAPAWAQHSEVALLGGYSGAGNIDKRAVGIQDLKIGGGFTWGVEFAHFFTPHVGVSFSWVQQERGLVLGTAARSAKLLDAKVAPLHANLLYQFGPEEARFKPFLFGGAGITVLSAPDLTDESKFSWALGAGLRWLPARRFGVLLQAGYSPTQLNDSSSNFCDPFGFCQDSLKQFELAGGVLFRF